MHTAKSLVPLAIAPGLAACQTDSASRYAGSGPVTLSPRVAIEFEKYRNLPTTSKIFAISKDGNSVWASWCKTNSCNGPTVEGVMAKCDRMAAGTCRIYAVGDRIVWQGPTTEAPPPPAPPAGHQVVATGPQYYNERALSAEWEGYAQPMKATVIFDPVKKRGSVLVELPGEEGTCSGDFVQSGDGGTWSISCPNKVDASGTYRNAGSGNWAAGTGTDSKGRQIRFTVAGK